MNYLKMYRNILANDKLWFIISLLLSAAFILIIFSDIGDSNLTRMYLNADKLYASVIFQDIFRDGTGINGWHLNGAPNFFPDMFFYFILMGILSDPLITDFVFSMVQYMAFLFLVYWLFRQLDKRRSIRYTTLFVYLMFFFLLIPVFANRFLITFQLLSISYHFGATIMALLGLNLFIKYIRTPKNRILLALILVTISGALSDRLFLVQFLFPTITLSVLLFNRSHRKNLLIPLSAILLSNIAGLFLFRWLMLSKVIYIIGTGFKMFNFDNIGNSWINLMDHMKGIFLNFHAERGFIIIAILALLGTIIYILKYLKPIFRGQGEKEDHIKYYTLIIAIVFMLVVFFMPVINGAYVGRAIIRFNFMALVMGCILLPMLMLSWVDLEKIISRILLYLLPISSIFFLVLFIVRVSNAELGTGLKNYFNFYPPRARILDELKEPYDLKYGVSNYWHAKYTTTYSRNGTRLYAVGDTYFKPSYHVTNENWYHSGGKGKHKDPVFNFMTIDGFSHTEKLLELFGNNIDTIYDDGNIIVVKLPEFGFERGTREIKVMDDN